LPIALNHPGLLFLGFLAFLPLILHFLERLLRRPVSFPPLRFFFEPGKRTERKKIRDRLLLLLRVLLPILAAFLIAGTSFSPSIDERALIFPAVHSYDADSRLGFGKLKMILGEGGGAYFTQKGTFSTDPGMFRPYETTEKEFLTDILALRDAITEEDGDLIIFLRPDEIFLSHPQLKALAEYAESKGKSVSLFFAKEKPELSIGKMTPPERLFLPGMVNPFQLTIHNDGEEKHAWLRIFSDREELWRSEVTIPEGGRELIIPLRSSRINKVYIELDAGTVYRATNSLNLPPAIHVLFFSAGLEPERDLLARISESTREGAGNTGFSIMEVKSLPGGTLHGSLVMAASLSRPEFEKIRAAKTPLLMLLSKVHDWPGGSGLSPVGESDKMVRISAGMKVRRCKNLPAEAQAPPG